MTNAPTTATKLNGGGEWSAPDVTSGTIMMKSATSLISLEITQGDPERAKRSWMECQAKELLISALTPV
jgi:hypothetical protein